MADYMTEAVEAAAEILMREMDCEMNFGAGDCPNCGTVPCGPHPETWYCQTHAIDSNQSPVCGTVDELLTDIAPIIERAVREQVADRIEQQARDAWGAAQSLGVTDAGGARAYRTAARIARGTA